MKKICFAFILMICVVHTSAQNAYQKIYGEGYGEDISFGTNRDYAILGAAFDSVLSPDFYLIKTDSNGITLWNKTYGGLNSDVGFRINQTKNQGYILGGITNSFGAGNNDFLLIKVDSIGAIDWAKTYGGTGNEISLKSVLLDPDNGYTFCGTSNSFGAGDYQVCVIKTDSTGVVMWSKAYGITGVADQANDIKRTADGGYIITGSTGSNVFLLKITSTGTNQWLKTYTKSISTDNGMKLQPLLGGGYLVAADGNGTYISLLRTDSLGSIIWSKLYYGLASINDLTLTNDNGFILTGVYSGSPGDVDAFLIKTDSAGDYYWGRTYGDSWSDIGCRVLSINNNYIIAGTRVVNSAAGNIAHTYLIKTDSVGDTGPCVSTISVPAYPGLAETAAPAFSSSVISVTTSNPTITVGSASSETTICFLVGIENNITNSKKITIYPNPATGQIHFLNIENGSEIEIYDGIGKLVLQTTLKDSNEYIDLTNREKGIYFYRIINPKKEISSGKFIVE